MTNNNSNKKLMFITVGVGGGNGQDISHALFYTIKHCNPSSVVFLASKESWDKVSVYLLKDLEGWNADLEIQEEIINEIDDFEFLHNKFSKVIKSYLSKGYLKENIIADYTSGTKAMSAAMVSSAIFNKIDTLTYVTGKRESGRVVSGTERQYPLSTLSIISKQTIEEAAGYFNNCQFNTTINMLSSSSIYPAHMKISNTIIQLSRFFDSWDKFNFKQAFEIIRKVDEDAISKMKLLGKIKKYRDNLLPILKLDELNIEKVDDLLFNAKRRADEGKYDDAVARIYRAIEMIGQIEFKKEFNCTTSDILIDNFDGSIKDFIRENCIKNEKGSMQTGLFQTINILAKVENEYGKLFIENIAELRKLLDNRNYSILAHGVNPITEKHFGSFYSFITEIFKLADKGKRNPDFKFPIIRDLDL